MNYLKPSIIYSIFVIYHYSTIVLSYDPSLNELLETEDLLPLHVARHEKPRPKSQVQSKPVAPLQKPIAPIQNVVPTAAPIRVQSNINDILESESLIPFDERLPRYKRDDDNVEGSGGEPSTITCHSLTCTGQDCLSPDTFNTSEPSKQCASEGSCYIRAKYNATLQILQMVEAKCDTRTSCEWQSIKVQEFTEVSSCCTENFCNDLLLLARGKSSPIHPNTYLLALLSIMTLIFASNR